MLSNTAIALLCRLIPDDEVAGLSDPALRDRLEQLVSTLHKPLWTTIIEPGLSLLDAEAEKIHDLDFSGISNQYQDDILKRLEEGRTRTQWPAADAIAFIAHAATIAAEMYYTSPQSTAWADIGYVESLDRDPGVPIEETVLSTMTLDQVSDVYDAVIIGSGAGGGTAAGVLAEAGLKVLVLERGEMLAHSAIPSDHLQNHRYHFRGHNTGPNGRGNPRVYAGDYSGADIVSDEPWSLYWSNNAMTVGGGTRVYQGMAWRMLPDDFRLASQYGVPEGSSLADWPITYDELEPYYTQAEWELGICGDGATHRAQGPRSRPYPMPPFPQNVEAKVLQRGADALGLSTGPVPLLINSEPYQGRAACVGCSHCVGFACPSNAKNGSFNTFLDRALASGRCDLLTGVQATEIAVDRSGKATGIDVVDWSTGARKTINAGHIVVAAGALESARLLLNSKSNVHPSGIGNRFDQVGRHVQGHVYVQAFGLFDEPLAHMTGPGVSISTCDYYYENAETPLGGVLHNEVVRLPIFHYFTALPPDAPRWGAGAKQAMREMYRRTAMVYGPVQEVPTPDCRVMVSEDVKDKFGNPVVRWGGKLHPDTIRAAELHRDRAEQWIAASGAKRTWTSQIMPFFYPGQHQAGSCRMGDDPETSVTDRAGRVHGHENLWVMDASLHVTNGGFNPVLTVFALALRSAAILAGTEKA